MDWCEFLTGRWGISVYFFAATLVLLTILKLTKHNKRKQIITPGRVMFVGTFISAFAYFIPLYLEKGLNGFTLVLNSFQHSFRIFGLDGGFVDFIAKQTYPEGIKDLYVGYGALLYFVAPVLTFGFILTFFKNFFAHLKYRAFFWAETHIFSELNEKSLALAKSISENKKPFLGFIPGTLIVFTDITDKKEELHLDLVEEAQGMGAVLFRKDLESVHFKFSWSLRKVFFYLISEDEAEKIRHTENIIKNYDDNNVGLWIFSDDIRTELILAKNEVKNMNITRVNDIQSLIYHNLDNNGVNLFKRARLIQGDEKVISVIIVGLGKYGQEMLKALVWYCQMEGYKLRINAFDTDKKAKDKLVEQCPELLCDKFNKKAIDGEPYYEIDIHSGVDVSVPEFEQKLKEINDATYIFVCLGNDEANLDAASRIRCMCERVDYIGDGRKPDIETVIYDSNIRKKLGITWETVNNAGQDNQGAINYKKQPYNILMTGDLEYFYSVQTVINSKLVSDGYDIHKSYCVESSRVCFAENYMLDEWKEFIRIEQLEDSWEKYFSDRKHSNNLEEAKTINLSDAKKEFSFMTSKEESDARTAVSEEQLLELKNSAAARIDRWEKQVYKKFDELKKIPEIAKNWQEIEKNDNIEAEKSFRFEYNYRSSIAKAIHKHLRQKIGLKTQTLNKAWEDLTLEEKVEIGKIEHVRWNAYMRTEGYSYASKRNDLAKVHHNLVPVSKLSYDDLRKDT